MKDRTQLLVSVKDAAEAAIALEGGADLIDVKDPSRGPLGTAHHEAVAAVLAVVGGAVPVSAALGDWHEHAATEAHWHLKLPLQHVKWGLAGQASAAPAWEEGLLETRRAFPAALDLVCVGYADAEAAKSPPLLDIVRFAKRTRFRTFLIDTFAKNGATLLDHLPLPELAEIVANLQRSKIRVALGGSLAFEQIAKLRPLKADWLAVRGAVCAGGTRDGSLDPVRVAKWAKALA